MAPLKLVTRRLATKEKRHRTCYGADKQAEAKIMQLCHNLLFDLSRFIHMSMLLHRSLMDTINMLTLNPLSLLSSFGLHWIYHIPMSHHYDVWRGRTFLMERGFHLAQRDLLLDPETRENLAERSFKVRT